MANKRTNKILEDIEILGNLANKNQYEYTDEQVKKIFEAIVNTVATTKESFKKKKPANKFSLCWLLFIYGNKRGGDTNYGYD